MTETVVQFQGTRFANVQTSTPNPQSSGHLNLDEGFTGAPPLPNPPGIIDYIRMILDSQSFQPWKINPLPAYVTEVTELCFQFYHNGSSGTVADLKLFDVETAPPAVLLQTVRVNLNTAGDVASQVLFDSFGTLTKDKVENYLALHIDMLPQGTSGGVNPPDMES